MKTFFSILTVGFLSFNGYGNPEDCITPITTTEFQTEVKKIEAHDFDEAKKTATEKLLTSKCFTSAQVKTLLEKLSFEEDKLEIAKKAYSRVTDKGNYGIVKTVFEFDSNKKALDQFMKK